MFKNKNFARILREILASAATGPPGNIVAIIVCDENLPLKIVQKRIAISVLSSLDKHSVGKKTGEA